MKLEQITTEIELKRFQSYYFKERSFIGEVRDDSHLSSDLIPLSLLRSFQVYFVVEQDVIVGGFCLQSGDKLHSLTAIKNVQRRRYLFNRMEGLDNLVEVLYFWTTMAYQHHMLHYRRFLAGFASAIRARGYDYVICRTANYRLIKLLSRYRMVMNLSSEKSDHRTHYLLMCRVSDLGTILSRLTVKKLWRRMCVRVFGWTGWALVNDPKKELVKFHPEGRLLLWEVMGEEENRI